MARCKQEEPAKPRAIPSGNTPHSDTGTARPREVTFGLRDLTFVVTFPAKGIIFHEARSPETKTQIKTRPAQISDIGWASRPRSNSDGYEEN